MRQCAELVSPLYDLMKERALSSKVVQTDDTPVPVLDPELPHTRTGRIWTYVGDATHPYTVYDYTPNRSRDGPDEFLKNFRGYLQADAYSGYDGSTGMPRAASPRWRAWRTPGGSTLKRSRQTSCARWLMLAYIHLLYDVEREAREGEMDPGQRHALRPGTVLADSGRH